MQLSWFSERCQRRTITVCVKEAKSDCWTGGLMTLGHVENMARTNKTDSRQDNDEI